jgi:2-phospho-L-lactate guanylyltransferase
MVKRRCGAIGTNLRRDDRRAPRGAGFWPGAPPCKDRAIATARIRPEDVHALVPIKRLDRAKGRLAGVLSQAERGALMLTLLDVVLTALRGAGIERVTLVTAEAIERPGVAVWHDRDLPWNEALAAATRELVSEPVVAFVSADLPNVQAADVTALLAATPGRGIAIARADDAGTNAIVMRPPGAMPTLFGAPGSAALHARTAEAAGLAATIVDQPGLAFDLDTPEHLSSIVRR